MVVNLIRSLKSVPHRVRILGILALPFLRASCNVSFVRFGDAGSSYAKSLVNCTDVKADYFFFRTRHLIASKSMSFNSERGF